MMNGRPAATASTVLRIDRDKALQNEFSAFFVAVKRRLAATNYITTLAKIFMRYSRRESAARSPTAALDLLLLRTKRLNNTSVKRMANNKC